MHSTETSQAIPPAFTELIDVSSIAFEARQKCLSEKWNIDEKFAEVVRAVISSKARDLLGNLPDAKDQTPMTSTDYSNLARRIFEAVPTQYEDFSNFITTKLHLVAVVERLAKLQGGFSLSLQSLAEKEFSKIVTAGELGLLEYIKPWLPESFFFSPKGTQLLLTAFEAAMTAKTLPLLCNTYPFPLIFHPSLMQDPRFVSAHANFFKQACEAGFPPPPEWSASAIALDSPIIYELSKPDSTRSIVQGIEKALERDDPSAIKGLLPLIAEHSERQHLRAALSERATSWILAAAHAGGVRNGAPLFNEIFQAGIQLSNPSVLSSDRFVIAIKDGIAQTIQEDRGLPALYRLASLVPDAYKGTLSSDKELCSAVDKYMASIAHAAKTAASNAALDYSTIKKLANWQQLAILTENLFGLDATCSKTLDSLLPEPNVFLRLLGLADRLSLKALAKASCSAMKDERALKQLVADFDQVPTLAPGVLEVGMNMLNLIATCTYLPSRYRLLTAMQVKLLELQAQFIPSEIADRIVANALSRLHPTDPLLERAFGVARKVSNAAPAVTRAREHLFAQLHALGKTGSKESLRQLAAAYRGQLVHTADMHAAQERIAKQVEQLSPSDIQQRSR